MLEQLSCEFKFIAKLFLSEFSSEGFFGVFFFQFNWFHFQSDITVF